MTKNDLMFRRLCDLVNMFMASLHPEISARERMDHVEATIQILDISLQHYSIAKMSGSINEASTTMESKIV